MYKERAQLFDKLAKLRNSKVLLYVTGDRRQLETQIGKEVLDFFVHHLDPIEQTKKISLFLYTTGGDVIASWSIVNLIRQFCEEFEVIVSSKALSGGTLICLGANLIVMTKQASLGPIDPSMNSPLNPPVPGAPPHAKAPISVEAINGYIEFARQTLGKNVDLSSVFLHLAQAIHPHVLGQAFRSRAQIRMLAKKLLSRHFEKREEDVTRILEFLCSESGSHDYTVTRQEARETLGLNVETPDENLYDLIRQIHEDFATELELRNPYDPNLALGSTNNMQYSFRRALIESVDGGSHVFLSEGILSRQQIQLPAGMALPPGVMPLGLAQQAITDNRSFEGWKHTK
jgi:hypothetical protein